MWIADDKMYDQSTKAGIMTCPNGGGFQKVLGSFGTPELRRLLFFSVCITVRLALYVTAIYYFKLKPIRIVLGILALIAAVNLIRQGNNGQWWSRKFQAVMAFLVVLGAVFNSKVFTAVALATSLLGGILQALNTTFC